MDNVLEVRNLSKAFPDFALRGVDFTLPRGYIMGLVGPNGAGKTTTIKLILNMIEKDSGEICIFGKDNVRFERAIKQDVGTVFDSIFYVEDWTAKDTEKAVSLFYENWSHQTFIDFLDRFQIPSGKKIKELSRGMKMKLMVACAFSHDAKLLILDEPTSGLDPVVRDDFLEILQEFIIDGTRSVLFSTHITSDLEQVADYVTFLNQGELIYTGSMFELLAKYKLIKGRAEDLTSELEKAIIGLRKTGVGFEGLIAVEGSPYPGMYVLDTASINDVVVHIGKEG